MIKLINKEVYSDYTIEINDYDLTLIIEGLMLLDKRLECDPEVPDNTYCYNLRRELEEIKEK